MPHYVLLISGVADLVSAIAALRDLEAWDQRDVVVVVAGHAGSLPAPLTEEVRRVAHGAFDIARLECFHWGTDDAQIAAFVAEQSRGGIVASNQLQSPQQRALIAALEPARFVFFDNGLSSYHHHAIDMVAWRATLPTGTRLDARLSLAAQLGTPPYLAPLDPASIDPEILRTTLAAIRETCLDRSAILPAGAKVILGTSFSRIGLFDADQEVAMHRTLLEAILERDPGPVFYKPHPRAQAGDLADPRVITLPTELPIEAFVDPAGPGTAYSFSSSALFSLEAWFGWTTHRVGHPQMNAVFAARKVLSAIARKPVTLPLDA